MAYSVLGTWNGGVAPVIHELRKRHASYSASTDFRRSYLVPVQHAHRKLLVIATIEEVRLNFEDLLVARHRRSREHERTFFEPTQYLALLECKPGGFDFTNPLEQWSLPDCFALQRRRLEADDSQHGTRFCIRVLRLLERYSLPQLTDAVEYALDIDVIDADSLRTIVEHRSDQAGPAVYVGLPTASGSRPRRDHSSLGRSSSADGGDAMTPTDTKSAVLLKHLLKALKLPTVLAECEKITQRCSADNADHMASQLLLCERELLEREHKY